MGDDPQYFQLLFILGPSRSGKTSLEGLVAQGSLVERGFENSIPIQVARKAFRMAGVSKLIPVATAAETPRGLRQIRIPETSACKIQ